MFAAAAAAVVVEGTMLSLSRLVDESHQSVVVRLVRGCTLHLLRVISICCACRADDMPPSAVNTFCNLLHTLTVSGHLADTGKLTSLFAHSLCVELAFLVHVEPAVLDVNLQKRSWYRMQGKAGWY